MSSPRLSLLAVIAFFAAGYGVLWLARRRKTQSPAVRAATERETAAREIVELYRQLEAALAARGVPRPSGTPPRAHAASLAALRHPVGEEALALTERYLSARFGGNALSSEERREYLRRVRTLRAQRQSDKAAA